MPKYFEFVFAAYAIWVVAFIFYFAHLYLRTRRTADALKTLSILKTRSSGSGLSAPSGEQVDAP